MPLLSTRIFPSDVWAVVTVADPVAAAPAVVVVALAELEVLAPVVVVAFELELLLLLPHAASANAATPAAAMARTVEPRIEVSLRLCRRHKYGGSPSMVRWPFEPPAF